MRVSSKITRSFYYFLRARGFDVSRFFELTSLEMEFLKSTSHWFSADKIELLLNALSKEYSAYFVDQDFITSVGHACFRLNAWGALDSVLKMKTKKPLFNQLSVFLSYFIEKFYFKPFKQTKDTVSGHCNMSSEEYPFITEYLRAILESLPMYTGENIASVKWIRYDITIQWEENQQTALFSSGLQNFKPELLRDFRKFLDQLEEEMSLQKELIQNKDKEIAYLKDLLLSQGIKIPPQK